MIKGNKFYHDNKEYRIEKRIATVGEYVIAIPELYQLNTPVRNENIIPFYTPIEVKQSFSNLVFFNNRECLYHKEYFVITSIIRQRIKTGETVKRFLGIPIWKTSHYEFIE